ncbi:MAG TPA: UbiA-like polyprenyltransferase [Gemmatimonadaceae bacterium]|nr:UbiA-like polyprenyltransferase [Gemmatimonadaceae bacterium]
MTSTSSMREAQTFAGRSAWIRYANLVKLPHTLFALPFALVGVVLASYVKPVSWTQVFWVTVAFTAARFAAMAFNRIVDRRLDALNPRTAAREIPAGLIGVKEAGAAVLIASALFVIAAWRLNPLCFALSPLALACILGYSYTKRFTRLAHLALGLGLSIAPVGGYLAIAGSWSTPWWALVLLSVAVMCWVAGFDIFYALQDVAFDREHGLFSIPAAIGPGKAIVVARVLHGITVLSLAAVGWGLGAGWLYAGGVFAVALLLLYEHSLVRDGNVRNLNAAFFTMNGVISIAFFGFVLAERLLLR